MCTLCRQSRLFLLDMLLGNPDRLPCETLGWRGNPHNILYACSGARAGRMVAIDSAVQRRPPGALISYVLDFNLSQEALIVADNSEALGMCGHGASVGRGCHAQAANCGWRTARAIG